MILSKNSNSLKRTEALLFIVFITITTINIAKAQQEGVGNNFLVDRISRYESSSNYASAEYIYDNHNKLLRRVITGKMIENGQLRNLKYVDVFEYEDNRVSKIHYYDSTYFMFSHDIYFYYDSQGKLIRKETWMNGSILRHCNYHYENEHVVSIYTDNTAPFETDTIIYDNSGNVSKHIQIYPITDMLGQPIPGEFEVREYDYEYDNSPRPDFGLDYLFAYNLIPWLGTTVPDEVRFLSNNNMTKAFFQQETYNYAYNEYGLPDTTHRVYDPVGPLPGNKLSITYKQIENTAISEIDQMVEISIYPNPAEDKIVIDYEYSGIIRIYDMMGKEILSENIDGKTDIDMGRLSKGIYNVIVFSEGDVIGKAKIVKQ